MVTTAWIDRPVDTQGCALCFHACPKRSMEAHHAKATATCDLPATAIARRERNPETRGDLGS
jgi:hypothetical protein